MDCDPIDVAVSRPSIIASIDSEMKVLGSGCIMLKDEGTDRRWAVELGPFLLSGCPVTQRQYSGFVVDVERFTSQDDLPVVDVSWLDAIEFCNALSSAAGLATCYSFGDSGEVMCDWGCDGYRLPSEAEWEFACRAGTGGVRYGELDEIAWYRGNSGSRLHPVGTKDPNAWGLCDTIGNVWEWCWDVYDVEVYGPYRVFRGGGWSDPARSCRASCRRKSHPTFSIDDLGFRLARSLK